MRATRGLNDTQLMLARDAGDEPRRQRDRATRSQTAPAGLLGHH
jgi:hypothetical protein